MASYPEYKGVVDLVQAIDDTYVRKDAPSVPVGGAKGEVLRKKSSTDGDAEWADPMYHFETLAQMQAALAQGQIPDGANIVVEEEQPGGNTGDTALDTTSENWVQNKVVATAISNLSSDIASLMTVKSKLEASSVTVPALSFYTVNDPALAGKIFAGFRVMGITNTGLRISQAYIDSTGFNLVLLNDTSGAVATGNITAFYIG